MAKKPVLIKALDIVPGKFYLAQSGKSWQPCTIKCTEDHGWQRGFVEITTGMYNPVATIEFLGSEKAMRISARRINDEWVFIENNGRPSLMLLTREWFDEHLKSIDQDIHELNEDMAKLKARRDELIALSLGSTALTKSVHSSTGVLL